MKIIACLLSFLFLFSLSVQNEKAHSQDVSIEMLQRNQWVGEMVLIPGGEFMMGSTDNKDSGCSSWHSKPEPDCRHEIPQHLVRVKQFEMGKYCITYKQWDACVKNNGCNGYRPHVNFWAQGKNRNKRPVVNVSWSEAQSFIDWINKETGKHYRLPSEAEWEYAARANSTTSYYWGNDVGTNNSNCEGCGSKWDKHATAPVGSFAPNAFGLYDMSGNVWQFVEDCYHSDYHGAPLDGSAWVTGNCNYRVSRGGSWWEHPIYVRVSARKLEYKSGSSNFAQGFRLARSIE